MYCKSLTNYHKLETNEVSIGSIPIGKQNPIRIQTMTNTLTKDVEKTTNQVISCFEKGADYVRITTPTLADVEAFKDIKLKLQSILSDKPLIADVHFNPKVAQASAEIAEKVRINPGNFINNNNKTSFSEKEYKAELNKIENICKPLISTCIANKTTLRIGTNHGSLSQRIINKYGNTEKGLVEATLEFLQICKQLNFNDVVVSIKSSNPTVMVHANRLLAAEMRKKKLIYPIHVGVTEAGNRVEGRIKSAIGIGALLIDGIGDTIRVSLTESPESELPVANKIVKHVNNRKNEEILPEIKPDFFSPYSFNRRKTFQVKNIGNSRVPVVFTDVRNTNLSVNEFSPDYILTTKNEEGEYLMSDFKTVTSFSEWTNTSNSIPLMSAQDYLLFNDEIELCFIETSYKSLKKDLLKKIERNKNAVLIAKSEGSNKIGELRLFYSELHKNKSTIPVILKFEYNETDQENFALQAAIDSSVFLIDGLADGIFIVNKSTEDVSSAIDISFEILQASHRRLSKTEFISCPSCGRTLFDLEQVTETVKARTKHLKGLKIAIMGCIVNGPGEVADADYGYIGAGNNLVTLFKGKTPVKKNIKEDKAVDELIQLIKDNDDWIDS